MRTLSFLLIAIAISGGGAAAYADEVMRYQLPFEFRVVNADGDNAAEGYGTLEWSGCGGAVYGFTGEKVDEARTSMTIGDEIKLSKEGWMRFSGAGLHSGQPLHVAFWAGNADLSQLNNDAYSALFCNPCEPYTCPIERSCLCDDDCWYLYETCLGLPDGVVYARAWMPLGVALELTTWQEPGESIE